MRHATINKSSHWYDAGYSDTYLPALCLCNWNRIFKIAAVCSNRCIWAVCNYWHLPFAKLSTKIFMKDHKQLKWIWYWDPSNVLFCSIKLDVSCKFFDNILIFISTDLNFQTRLLRQIFRTNWGVQCFNFKQTNFIAIGSWILHLKHI